MTFLHSGILAALALTAVPVVLHLLLKQKPKKIDFPALRLVKTRSKRSTKRLRFRHLLLLILRVVLIGGIVLAAARPLLPAADWSFRWWDGLIFAGLIAGAVFAQRFWTERNKSIPAQVVREQRDRKGGIAIWGAAALIGALAILLPYSLRVSRSMKEAPTAEDLNLPIAGVIVFDVSASMSYREAGKTLLDVGRQIVADHVGDLPEGSRICVTDNATDQPLLFQLSLSSVPSQLERLTSAANARPLNTAIADAFEAQRDDRQRVRDEGGDTDRYVRRVYVVTDMAKTAWQFPDAFELEATFAADDSPSLFVLDVGIDEPRNAGFAKLDLSSEEIPRGGLLSVRTRFQTSMDVSAEADLFLGESGAARVASKEVSSDGETIAFMPTMSFETGDVDGTVRLTTSDPLAIDDERYFSVGVAALPKMLVVRPKSTELGVAWELLGGVDTETGFSVYDMAVVEPGQLQADTLDGIDVVCLVNVPSLQDSQWNLLTKFVTEGGGLATFLGDEEIESFSYNRAAAQEVLPAQLDVWGSRPDTDMTRMVFVKKSGPFVDRLATYEGSPEVFEDAVSIKRFWRLRPQADATIIARLSFDALPALMSRRVGKGSSVLLATGFNQRARLESWNNFLQPYTGDYWPPLLFLDQLTRYLARISSERRNFIAGEIPVLSLPDDLADDRLLLRMPDLRNLPVEATSERSLALPMATIPGHYAVATSGGNVISRFSVNHRAEESDMTRADASDLASVFGDGNFEIARTLEELNEEIDVARFGQEAFPMLVLLAVLFFAAETLLASRFYDDGQPGQPGSMSRRVSTSKSPSTSESDSRQPASNV